jgi:hypothetical protein
MPAVLQNAGTVVLLRAFLVTMATSETKTYWGLLAVDLYVAKAVTVVVLYEVYLGFECLDLHNNITEAGKDQDLP